MVTQGSAGNGGDVVVGIKVLSAQALKELDKVKASVKTMGTNMRLPGFESPGKLKEMSNVLLANQKNMTNFWDNYMSSVKGAKRITEDLGKSTKKFSMWALGVMFFGQALKRVFGSIAKSGIRVFQDVMHSVQGTVTNFDLLKGSLLFLSFSIGQALEPMIRFLIPIIDLVSEWVTQNQTLAATIIAGGLAFGTLLAVVGSGVLAFDSMAKAITRINTGLAAANMGTLGAFFTNPVTLSVITALAALAVVSWATWKNVPGIMGKIKDIFSELKEPLGALKTDFIELIQSILPSFDASWQTVGGVLLWFTTIFVDFIKVFVNGARTIVNASSAIINVLKAIDRAFALDTDGARRALNAAKRDLTDFADSFSSTLQGVIDAKIDFGNGPGAFIDQLKKEQRQRELDALLGTDLMTPERNFTPAPVPGQFQPNQPIQVDLILDGEKLQSVLLEPLSSQINRTS